MITRILIAVLAAGCFVPGAYAAEATGHEGHNMDPHAGHRMGAPVTDGPWSYSSRKNPEPYTRNRWEMLPAPGNPMMFVSQQNLSPEERCKIVRESRAQIADRATQAACGSVPPPAPAPVRQDHSGH